MTPTAPGVYRLRLADIRSRIAPTVSDVPCDGCTRCCRGDTIRIMPHEDPSQWQTEPHPAGHGMRQLAHKPDGDCVYLGASGCTIHGRAPQICKEMDCRLLYRAMSFTVARKQPTTFLTVWMRGRDLCVGGLIP